MGLAKMAARKQHRKQYWLMTLPLTVGTHVEGNGTGTQRENAKMAATLKLLLAYTAVVTTEGRPVKLAEP